MTSVHCFDVAKNEANLIPDINKRAGSMLEAHQLTARL